MYEEIIEKYALHLQGRTKAENIEIAKKMAQQIMPLLHKEGFYPANLELVKNVLEEIHEGFALMFAPSKSTDDLKEE